MSDDRLKLGVMVHLHGDPEGAIRKVADLGLPSCQLGWPPNLSVAEGLEVKRIADDHGVEITTLWAALPGIAVWDFIEGPITIGLVPEEYEGQAAYIYDFSPRPILTHDWNGKRVGDLYVLSVTVENHGAAPADGCTVSAGFDAGNDSMWYAAQSEPFTLQPREVTDVELVLTIPTYNHTRLSLIHISEPTRPY